MNKAKAILLAAAMIVPLAACSAQQQASQTEAFRGMELSKDVNDAIKKVETNEE